jgi:hypothetical protein
MGSVAGYTYWDWVIGTGVTVSIISEDSNYPAENAQNREVADACRTTAKVGIKYRVDLSTTYQPKFYAFLNHNLSGGTFKVFTYTAGDWSTGKKFVLMGDVRLLDQFCEIASAPTTKRYWEFDFTDATSADSYFEFGRFMLYTGLTGLEKTEDWKMKRGYVFQNIVNETKWGVRWSHEIQEKRERFELNWTVSKEDETANPLMDKLRGMYEDTNGGSKPFVFIPSSDKGDTNLVTNGEFSSDTTGWSAYNSATLASIAGGKTGNCLSITENGDDNPGASQDISVTAGDWYYFQVFAKKAAEDEFRVVVWDVTNAANILNTGFLTESDADWSQGVRFFFQAPTGCVSARILLETNSLNGEAKSFLFDTCSLQRFHEDCYCTYLEDPVLEWTDVELGEYAEGVTIRLIEATRGKV